LCVIVVVALLSIARLWGHWRRRHLKRRTAHKSLAVVMLHPDLGLGGAERLVVDAAVGLTQRGHAVRMVTNYHNAARAFAETTDGACASSSPAVGYRGTLRGAATSCSRRLG
jgi:hypothetical protein